MKTSFSKFLLALCVAISLISAVSSAEAYQCKYTRGYWHNGYYHRGHKVCYHQARHCGWRNGHKVCWYN